MEDLVTWLENNMCSYVEMTDLSLNELYELGDMVNWAIREKRLLGETAWN